MDKGAETIRPQVSEAQKYKSNLATLKTGEANPQTLKAMTEVVRSPFLTYSAAAGVLPDATKVFQDAYGRDKGWEFFRDNPKMREPALEAYEQLFRMAKVGNNLSELTRLANEFPGGKKDFKERKRIRQFLTGGYPPDYEPFSEKGNRALARGKKAIRDIDSWSKMEAAKGDFIYSRDNYTSELRVSSNSGLGASGESVGRVYINPKPEAWSATFNYLSYLLSNRPDLPFTLKTFDMDKQLSALDLLGGRGLQEWEILNAGDKMVLYFDKADEDLIASAVLEVYHHAENQYGTQTFEESVPVFAERFKDAKGNVLPGIAFAQEPASPFDNKYSFNTQLQEVIESSWAYLGTEAFDARFKKGLENFRRDPSRPAFNTGDAGSSGSFPSISHELL